MLTCRLSLCRAIKRGKCSKLDPNILLGFLTHFDFMHTSIETVFFVCGIFFISSRNIIETLSPTTCNHMHHMIEVQGGPFMVISELLNVTVVQSCTPKLEKSWFFSPFLCFLLLCIYTFCDFFSCIFLCKNCQKLDFDCSRKSTIRRSGLPAGGSFMDGWGWGWGWMRWRWWPLDIATKSKNRDNKMFEKHLASAQDF